VAGADFCRDADKGFFQILERDPAHMLLHARRQPHAAEQAAAAQMQVEQSENTALREAAGEFFQFVQLAGQIAAADQGADRGAGDHVDLDAGFVERAQDADMGPAAGRAAAERQSDAGLGSRLRFGRVEARRRLAAVPDVLSRAKGCPFEHRHLPYVPVCTLPAMGIKTVNPAFSSRS
jgi:hypothetical protein